jgi:adenylate cyclase
MAHAEAAIAVAALPPQPVAPPNPFTAWLSGEGWDITEPKDLIGRLAEVFVEAGIPLYRVRVIIRILHPQVIGTTYT